MVPTAYLLAPANILGVLSLVFWSLIIVISIKYIGFVMRANNKGEGGILSLMSLVSPQVRQEDEVKDYRNWILIIVGLFGAALLYGDGIITPAISVLSAVEGLQIATPKSLRTSSSRLPSEFCSSSSSFKKEEPAASVKFSDP